MLDEPLDVVDRRLRDEAVADVEDVTRAAGGAVEDVLDPVAELAPGRQQRRGIEVPLHRPVGPEPLDLGQSIQRIQKEYPDLPRDEVEEFLLDWIDMGYDPENYSQAQLDELDSLTERWVADHLRKKKASKKQKRTRHS